MRCRLDKTAWLMIAFVMALPMGCGTTQIQTTAIEERYFGMGYARDMFAQGEDLLKQGYYREAYTAFGEAERTAYTVEVRSAARERRIWLQKAIAAMEKGQRPEPPPLSLLAPPPEPQSEQTPSYKPTSPPPEMGGFED